VYRILYLFFSALARLAVRSGRSKDLEIIVLRHQLMVLGRQDARPELNDVDRTLLGAIAAALPGPQRLVWLVTPDTLLRWHRQRIARHWTLWVPEMQSLCPEQNFRGRALPYVSFWIA
jgi:hypothetical protein